MPPKIDTHKCNGCNGREETHCEEICPGDLMALNPATGKAYLRAARDCWEHIAATHLQGLPIARLVCTHMHYDHAGLAHWLCERFGIPLYMTHGEYFMMRTLAEPVPHPLPSAQAC